MKKKSKTRTMLKEGKPNAFIAEVTEGWPLLGELKNGAQLFLTKGGVSIAWGGSISTLGMWAFPEPDADGCVYEMCQLLDEISEILQPLLARAVYPQPDQTAANSGS